MQCFSFFIHFRHSDMRMKRDACEGSATILNKTYTVLEHLIRSTGVNVSHWVVQKPLGSKKIVA